MMNIKYPRKGFNMHLDAVVPFTLDDKNIRIIRKKFRMDYIMGNFKTKTRHCCLFSDTFFAPHHITNTMI